MGYQANYSRREFSRGTKAIARGRATGADGVVRCRCGTVLTAANTEYDHIVPWWIKRHSGPSNCQALCLACHAVKTAADQGTIAKGKRLIRGRRPARHPMPCGRRSRFTKTIGGRVERRMTATEKHAAAMAARAIVPPDVTSPPTAEL